jgi:hypothetical protein
MGAMESRDEPPGDERFRTERSPANDRSRGRSRDEPSRDERLYVAAAAHHDYAAETHDIAAMWHERRGEAEAAQRERVLAEHCRDKAREARRRFGRPPPAG